MTDRVAELVSQIRLNIGEISTDSVSNSELWKKLTRIQNQILFDTDIVEKDFQITMVADQESYDFYDERVLFIKKIWPSWEGTIDYIPNGVWDEYRASSGDVPDCLTIFAKKIWVSPIPASTEGFINLWGYQKETIAEIDNVTDPEVPVFCDNALIYGVSMQYNPERWSIPFEQQMSLIRQKQYEKQSIKKDRTTDLYF